MGLSVVIPVWNDEKGLATLLKHVGRSGCFDEVVVVDDASDRPVDPRKLGGVDLPSELPLVLLRNAHRRGAGYGRNRGLKHVTNEAVIFLDSDDRPTREFAYLAGDLAHYPTEYDICLFAHVDSRSVDRGGWGPLPDDMELWQRAGIFGALTPLSRSALPTIIQIAAYPWNKIYRVAFLREKKLGCTETSVHNDIELHWRSMIAAKRILVSDRMSVLHSVSENGRRLTNQRGSERLEVIHALRPVALDVATLAPDLIPAFGRFVIRLFHWGLGTLEEDLRPAYRAQARRFLRETFDASAFRCIADSEPWAATAILDFLEPEPAG